MTPLLPEHKPAKDGTYNAAAPSLTAAGENALARFTQHRAAKAIDRLEADRELLTTMGLEQFKGRTTTALELALVEYGYAVIGAWLSPKTNERLYLEANLRGFGIAEFAQRKRFTQEHRDTLRNDVVVKCVPTFLSDVLASGRWDHRKGASIKTFFIGWCVMRFRDVFRTFLTEHAGDFDSRVVEFLEDHDRGDGFANPASVVLENETRNELLDHVEDATMRQIVELRADNYTNREIAELLDITVGAVESRWHRWKRDNHPGKESHEST